MILASKFMLFGFYLFSFSYVLSKAFANISLAIFFIGYIWTLKIQWQHFLKDPLFKLSIIWFIYLLFEIAWGTYLYPNTFLLQAKNFFVLFSFSLIPGVAYILKGNQQRVVLSLILFLTGFLIRLFYDANILSPGPFLDYREYIFSTDKNFAAIIIDTTMVGVLLFSTYFIIDFIQKKNTVAIYNILISLVVLIPTILAWSSLNSRAAWISLAISSLFIVIILMFQTKQQGFTKKYAIVFFIFFISVISLALLVRGDMIISKLTSESKTWQAILSMDLENIPKTSIGLRIHMWHYAIQLWLQHPLLGHGLNITHLTSNIPAEMGFKGFANLHNAYLEILARTGLIGLIFYISALFITLKAVFKAYTQHYIPLFLFIFFIEILLIFLFNNVSVGFIFFQHGWQYIVLFGGIAYSYRYAQMKPEGE